MLSREKYDEIRKLFEDIDRIISSEKPKDTKLRNKLWEIFEELNS